MGVEGSKVLYLRGVIEKESVTDKFGVAITPPINNIIMRQCKADLI